MRLLTLFLLLVVSFSISAQDKGGVVFQEKSFDELLATAKAENKLIFLDAYTTWCGPCKMMTAQVFPLESVGAVYNEKFINAKFDMEKGEGPALAKRYSVVAYPTYLFINGDGELVHKGLGYIEGDKLLALADVAESDKNLLAMNNRYDGGERSEEFVTEYINTLNDVYEKAKAGEVTQAYVQTLDKSAWKSEAVMRMILANPGELDGECFAFMMDNAEAFGQLNGKSQFAKTIQSMIINHHMKSSGKRGMPAVADIQSDYEKYAGSMASQLSDNYAMIYASRMAPEEYPALAVAYYGKYPSDDAMELNSIAWNFYENVDDPNHLKSALGWAMTSVRLDKQYMNMDTLAWLYKKMGNDAKAKEVALEAIELAKVSGEDYSSTTPILEE